MSSYQVGQTMTGSVFIQFKEDMEGRANLKLTYKVKEKLQYVVKSKRRIKSTSNSKTLSDSDAIYQYGVYLFAVPSRLRAGVYSYNFSLFIPEELPASFAYEWNTDNASVRHKLVAEVTLGVDAFKHYIPVIVTLPLY
jgi:hypothetical protein